MDTDKRQAQAAGESGYRSTGTPMPAETRKRRHRRRLDACCCCRQEAPFCWQCRCGFSICQVCMGENVWGMSCNGITWQCPDCGAQNGFGNQ